MGNQPISSNKRGDDLLKSQWIHVKLQFRMTVARHVTLFGMVKGLGSLRDPEYMYQEKLRLLLGTIKTNVELMVE